MHESTCLFIELPFVGHGPDDRHRLAAGRPGRLGSRESVAQSLARQGERRFGLLYMPELLERPGPSARMVADERRALALVRLPDAARGVLARATYSSRSVVIGPSECGDLSPLFMNNAAPY